MADPADAIASIPATDSLRQDLWLRGDGSLNPGGPLFHLWATSFNLQELKDICRDLGLPLARRSKEQLIQSVFSRAPDRVGREVTQAVVDSWIQMLQRHGENEPMQNAPSPSSYVESEAQESVIQPSAPSQSASQNSSRPNSAAILSKILEQLQTETKSPEEIRRMLLLFVSPKLLRRCPIQLKLDFVEMVDSADIHGLNFKNPSASFHDIYKDWYESRQRKVSQVPASTSVEGFDSTPQSGPAIIIPNRKPHRGTKSVGPELSKSGPNSDSPMIDSNPAAISGQKAFRPLSEARLADCDLNEHPDEATVRKLQAVGRAFENAEKYTGHDDSPPFDLFRAKLVRLCQASGLGNPWSTLCLNSVLSGSALRIYNEYYFHVKDLDSALDAIERDTITETTRGNAITKLENMTWSDSDLNVGDFFRRMRQITPLLPPSLQSIDYLRSRVRQAIRGRPWAQLVDLSSVRTMIMLEAEVARAIQSHILSSSENESLTTNSGTAYTSTHDPDVLLYSPVPSSNLGQASSNSRQSAYPMRRRLKPGDKLNNGEIARCRICQSTNHFARACTKQSGASVLFCPVADDPPSDVDETAIDELYITTIVNAYPDAHSTSTSGPRENAIRPFLAWRDQVDVGYLSHAAPTSSFVGFVVDSAATKSFCGVPQWQSFQVLGAKTRPVSLSTTGLWAGGKQLGNFLATVAAYEVTLTLVTQLQFTVHIVREDIPFLIGLDVQSSYKFVIKPGANSIHLEEFPDFPLPTVRKGLLYIVLNGECFYTEAELAKLHRQFGHASAQDLEFVLSRSQKKELESSDKQLLGSIVRRCFICQTYARSPKTHAVSTHVGCVFNHQVYVDGIALEGLPTVLHMVCRGTRYARAVPLQDESGAGMWDTFLRCWVNTVVGIPHFIILDSLPANVGEFQLNAQRNGIQVIIAPKEHHAGMGVVERHHEPLRRIYSKLRASQPAQLEKLSNETLLSIACKAMNDTGGPEGVCPTLCVFGMLPQLALSTVKQPDSQQTRLRAQAIAKLEWEAETAKLRVRLALRSKTPTDPHDGEDLVGKPVLIFRRNVPGKPKRWIGPYIVHEIVGKHVHVIIPPQVQERPGPPNISVFPMDLVKRYHPSAAYKPMPHSTQPSKLSGDALDDGLALVTESDSICPLCEETFVSETVSSTNALNDPQFSAAAIAEIRGLLQKKAIEVLPINYEQLPRTAHVIGGRFLFVLKDSETEAPRHKARFICQGFGDNYSDEFVVQAPTLSRLAMRLLVTYAEECQYDLCFEDCSQAYLQSNSTLTREVFLLVPLRFRPIFESALSQNHDTRTTSDAALPLTVPTPAKYFYVKVLLPLYGLVESGTHWYTTFASTLTNELQLRKADIDSCLLYRPNGIIGLVVDDSIFAGSPEFLQSHKQVMSTFETSGIKQTPYTFNGTVFLHREQGLLLHQTPYISKKFDRSTLADVCRAHSCADAYRILRGRLMWVATNTRPDLLFEVALASRIQNPSASDLRVLVNRLERIYKQQTVEGMPVGILFNKPSSGARVVVFTDASRNVFDREGQTPEVIAQLAFVVWLIHDDNSAYFLTASSTKSKRQTNSVLAAETFAFSAGYQAGVMCRELLNTLLDWRPALDILTDSKSLVDTLSATSITRELTLMSHVAYLREAFALGEIDRVGHVTGATNYADALTKRVPHDGQWAYYQSTGRLRFTVSTWIAPIAASPQQETGMNVEHLWFPQPSSPPKSEGDLGESWRNGASGGDVPIRTA